MKTVLTIAGFDPSSGAGITADLAVFAAHGLFGTAAVTALTVQSTLGVRASHPVDAAILGETLDCLSADLRPSGVKVGLTAAKANMCVISRYVVALQVQDSRDHRPTVVLDPILASSSGLRFLDLDALEVLKTELLPLVDWVTPNLDELAALTGYSVGSQADMLAAARVLQVQIQRRPTPSQPEDPRPQHRKLGVFAKGGHLEKPDDLLLTPDGEEHWLEGERIATNATHGTGCALSSAFLSGLMLGHPPVEAARKAKHYVAEAMRRAPAIGSGKGPMELLWPLLSSS
jgi:hydroxymethylpyrimidine/phosphomethylpyrimidine kinase